MTFDLSKVREVQEKLAKNQAPQDHLVALKQARVHASYLTGNEHWDKFLSWLQAEKNDAEKQRDVCIDKLGDPMQVNHEQIMKYKVRKAQFDERIKTLDQVMELPKTLKEKGEVASDLLKSA